MRDIIPAHRVADWFDEDTKNTENYHSAFIGCYVAYELRGSYSGRTWYRSWTGRKLPERLAECIVNGFSSDIHVWENPLHRRNGEAVSHLVIHISDYHLCKHPNNK